MFDTTADARTCNFCTRDISHRGPRARFCSSGCRGAAAQFRKGYRAALDDLATGRLADMLGAA